MNQLFTFIIEFLFGVRVEGEKVDLTPPSPSEELPPVDQTFFMWCEQFRVGCMLKNQPIFW